MRKKVKTIEIDGTQMPQHLQDMLGGLIEKLEERQGRSKEEIGKLPTHLKTDFMKFKLMEESIEKEMEARKEALIAQIALEFVDKAAQVEDMHKNIWEKIYTHFNLDPEKSYTYNQGKNTVYRYTDDE